MRASTRIKCSSPVENCRRYDTLLLLLAPRRNAPIEKRAPLVVHGPQHAPQRLASDDAQSTFTVVDTVGEHGATLARSCEAGHELDALTVGGVHGGSEAELVRGGEQSEGRRCFDGVKKVGVLRAPDEDGLARPLAHRTMQVANAQLYVASTLAVIARGGANQMGRRRDPVAPGNGQDARGVRS